MPIQTNYSAIINPTFLAPNELSQGITALANVTTGVDKPAVAYGTNAATTATTMTAAGMTAGQYMAVYSLTGTFGGPANLTVDTVANVVAALQSAYGSTFNPVGFAWIVRVLNITSQTQTLTTNTGWTLTGTLTLSNNTFRDCLCTIATSTTATLQTVGLGTMP